MPIVRTTDVARVTSWREGRVIFDDDNLSVVVAEMNRYSRRHIVLGDRRLADLEVSGAFDTGKTDVFVEALVTYFPIKVVQQNNDSIVLAWNGG
jgi:transmembrane sensor